MSRVWQKTISILRIFSLAAFPFSFCVVPIYSSPSGSHCCPSHGGLPSTYRGTRCERPPHDSPRLHKAKIPARKPGNMRSYAGNALLTTLPGFTRQESRRVSREIYTQTPGTFSSRLSPASQGKNPGACAGKYAVRRRECPPHDSSRLHKAKIPARAPGNMQSHAGKLLLQALPGFETQYSYWDVCSSSSSSWASRRRYSLPSFPSRYR